MKIGHRTAGNPSLIQAEAVGRYTEGVIFRNDDKQGWCLAIHNRIAPVTTIYGGGKVRPVGRIGERGADRQSRACGKSDHAYFAGRHTEFPLLRCRTIFKARRPSAHSPVTVLAPAC